MHKGCYGAPVSHVTVCPHPEPWGTVVLWVAVGLPLLIVAAAILAWIKYRNG